MGTFEKATEKQRKKYIPDINYNNKKYKFGEKNIPRYNNQEDQKETRRDDKNEAKDARCVQV